MARNEKGRPGEGSPIPNAFVYYDATESNSNLARFQALRVVLAMQHGVAVETIVHAVAGGPLAVALELAVLKIDAQDLPHFDLSQSVPAAEGTRVLAFSNLFGVATGRRHIDLDLHTRRGDALDHRHRDDGRYACPDADILKMPDCFARIACYTAVSRLPALVRRSEH